MTEVFVEHPLASPGSAKKEKKTLPVRKPKNSYCYNSTTQIVIKLNQIYDNPQKSICYNTKTNSTCDKTKK